MLTKKDLAQIRSLVREEIQQETRKIIREEVPLMIQKETTLLKKEIDGLRKEVKKEFKWVNGRINLVISGFASDIHELRKRLN